MPLYLRWIPVYRQQDKTLFPTTTYFGRSGDETELCFDPDCESPPDRTLWSFDITLEVFSALCAK